MDEEDIDALLLDYEEKLKIAMTGSNSIAELEAAHVSVKERLLIKFISDWRWKTGTKIFPPDEKENIINEFEKLFRRLKLNFSKTKMQKNSVPPSVDTFSIKTDTNLIPAIGIDLGTTRCCVIVYTNGKCEVIPNRSQGNKNTTPSIIAFHKKQDDTYGQLAKDQAYRFPETTIYDAKRMIGRAFTDYELQRDMRKWPFTIVNSNGNPKIRIFDKERSPHEISAKLLARFRLMADDHLELPHGSVTKAVITVPAYFTEPQRRATMEAAKCAGLKVLKIINEPTAAPLASCFQKRVPGERKVLIYDLGGGTFDVVIAKVTANEIDKEVKIFCVDGNTHLGGHDFDQLLMTYSIKKFSTMYNPESAAKSSNPQKRSEAKTAISRIRAKCEEAKESLTTSGIYHMEIEKIYDGRDLNLKIKRARLENLVEPLVKETIDIVERAINTAKIYGIRSKADIYDVILVGGSTRMPIVKKMIGDYFGKTPHTSLNPDEAVAYGAAITAAKLNRADINPFDIYDVTPFSLGINTAGGELCILIDKNSKIPCEVVQGFVTTYDNQTAIEFKVYQGENEVSSRNKLLGTFILEGIPSNPKGEESVSVTMTIDEDGILRMEATSRSTGISESIRITAQQMGLDDPSIEKIKIECQKITNY